MNGNAELWTQFRSETAFASWIFWVMTWSYNPTARIIKINKVNKLCLVVLSLLSRFWPLLRLPFLKVCGLCRKATNGLYSVSRSEEHTSELQSRENLVCRLLLEKKKTE